MKNCLFILAFMLVGLSAYSDGFKKIKVLKAISFKVPDSYTPVSEEELTQRYISDKRPLAFYANPTRQVDFMLNYASTTWPGGDMNVLMQIQKSNIRAYFDTVTFQVEKIREINGRPFIYFEFVSTLEGRSGSVVGQSGKSRYTAIAYTVVNGKTLVFTLNAPVNLRSEIEPAAEEIFNSIKIKKTL